MIDEKAWLEWLDHPVTREFRKVLNAKRADLRNEWEQSEPLGYLHQELILANVANIGWCRGLSFAETMDYEQYLTEIGEPDAKPKRASPNGSGGVD